MKQTWSTQSQGSRLVREGPVAIRLEQSVDVSREVRGEDGQMPAVVEVAGVDAHPGLFPPILTEGAAGQNGVIGEAAVAVVPPEVGGSGVIGDVDVLEAVVVVVQEEDAEAIVRLAAADARSDRDVLEGAVPVVAVEQVRAPGIASGSASHPQTGKEALGGVVLRRELHVAGYVEIQEPVAIVVPEGGAGGPAAPRDSRFPRDLHEGPIPLVSEEEVSGVAGDEQIPVSVVVDVGGHGPHGPQVAAVDTGPAGHILEGPVATVPIERASGGRLRVPSPDLVQRGTVGQVQIHPAVSVVVEPGGPMSQRLQQGIFPGSARKVFQGDACLGGPVHEGDSARVDPNRCQRQDGCR